MGRPLLIDEFDDPQGRFINYDTYDSDVRRIIRSVKHVDIRVFQQDATLRQRTLFDLDQSQMSVLDTEQMTDLEQFSVIRFGENWTAGTVGPQADRNNWLGLTLPVNGSATTQSVMVDDPVDIATGFAPTDVLSIALPAFPLTALILANTYIDLTSEPSGNFTTGPTASIPFSASTTVLVNGDSEFTIPLSAITGIDKTKITGVRFRVASTSSVSFRVTALRLLAASWQYGAVDIDTRYQRIRSTPSRDGSIDGDYAYEQPQLWRSSAVPGSEDPKPINTKIGAVICTGSQIHANRFSFYFREGNQDFSTQLDLNGLTMADLNGNPQPDYGPALWQTRPQTDLDLLTQSQLEGTDQTILERTADKRAEHWIEFALFFGPTPRVTILDSEGNGYQNTGAFDLNPNSQYLFVAELVESTARAYVYEINANGTIISQVFDSGRIYDTFILKREKGRFGWFAELLDGDANVSNIQSRGVVYAEFRSRPFESITPVQGVELFSSGAKPRELFENFTLFTVDPTSSLVRDTINSRSGESWKIVNGGTHNIQGVKSNPLPFTDFENVEILFDLFIPSAVANNAPPTAYLLGLNGSLIPLVLNRIVPDQWQTHRATLTDLTILTGTYQLILVQETTGQPYTWWIDNPHTIERSVRWQARLDRGDPWDEEDSGWLDFGDNFNRESTGIMFGERGTRLQVRAQAVHHEAFINTMKVRPRYAELGRLVQISGAPINLPQAAFTNTNPSTGLAIFDGSTSFAVSGHLINYEWTFGDGEIGYGQIVQHVYDTPGSYVVGLVVTDDSGARGITTQTVIVT